ncbi:hypothetical protein D3C72_1653550 [compost metagenome]
MSGRPISTSATSNWPSRTRRMASCAVSASPATSIPSSVSSMRRTPLRTMQWSSTSKTLILRSAICRPSKRTPRQTRHPAPLAGWRLPPAHPNPGRSGRQAARRPPGHRSSRWRRIAHPAPAPSSRRRGPIFSMLGSRLSRNGAPTGAEQVVGCGSLSRCPGIRAMGRTWKPLRTGWADYGHRDGSTRNTGYADPPGDAQGVPQRRLHHPHAGRLDRYAGQDRRRAQ